MNRGIAHDSAVLGVDTASSVGSVAIVQGKDTLAEKTISIQGTFSERLLPAINELFTSSGICLDDIGLMSISSGPGSFTGLRIGLATIKTLAYTKGVPAVGVDSLQVLACNSGAATERTISVLPARPGWVYWAAFLYSEQGIRCQIPASLCSVDEFLTQLQSGDHLVGQGALKYREMILEIAPGTRVDPDPFAHAPRGRQVARLGLECYLERLQGDPSRLAPRYLQPSMAELRAKVERR